MPRYVILLHEMPPTADRSTHWDFMLEDGGSLKTWALASPLQADEEIQSEQLADHRCEYLQYEGPVSGDRGSVTRWDEGVFEWIHRSKTSLLISIRGKRLSGTANLVRIGKADESAAQRWSVSLRKS